MFVFRKRALALLSAVLILAVAVAPSISLVFGQTESEAKDALVAAWQNMGQNKATTLAFADANAGVTAETLPVSLGLTDSQRAQFGERFCTITLGTQVTNTTFPYVNKNLNGFDKVTISYFLPLGSPETKVQIGLALTANSENEHTGGKIFLGGDPLTLQGGFHTLDVTADSSARAAMEDTLKYDADVTSMSITRTVGNDGSPFYVGSLIGWNLGQIEMPEGYEEMTLAQLVKAAQRVDLGTCTNVEAFEEAVINARKILDDGSDKPALDLIAAWKAMKADTMPVGYSTLALKPLVEAAKLVNTSGLSHTDFDAALQTAIEALPAPDPEDVAVENLIAAWTELSKDSKKVVEQLAIPVEYVADVDGNVVYRTEVTAGTTVPGITDPVNQLGMYYVDQLKYSDTGKAPNYNKYLEFQMLKSPVDTRQYQTIYFYVAAFDTEKAPGYIKIDAQTNSSASAFTESNKAWVKAQFARTVGAATHWKFFCLESQAFAYISYGSVFGERIYTPYLPATYAAMSVDELVMAAKEVDYEGLKGAEDFKKALDELEPYADEATGLRKELVAEWKKLSRSYTDYLAQPKESYTGTDGNTYERQAITKETKVSGLPDATVLGDYYVDHIAVDTIGWSNTWGFKILKEGVMLNKYETIYAWYATYNADGIGTKTKACLQVNNSSNAWTEGANWTKARVANAALALSGLQLVIEENIGKDIAALSLGGVFGTYTIRPELPEDYENISFQELIEAAEAADVEPYEADAFKAVLKKCQDLIKNRRNNLLSEWDKLGLEKPEGADTMPVDKLVEAAQALDFSQAAVPTDDFGQVLWMCSRMTAQGQALNALRNAWKKVGVLPTGYRLMTPEKWVEAADKLDISMASYTEQVLFNEALDVVRDLLSRGKADITSFKETLDKANKLNWYDFTDESWTAFGLARDNANKVLKNYDSVTQKTVDKAEQDMLAVWGDLKMYKRTLWLNFLKYYDGSDPQAGGAATSTLTDAGAEKIKPALLNGVNTGLMVNNQPTGWYPVNHGGIKLENLVPYQYFEMWFKADPATFKGTQLCMQLMSPAGDIWYDLWFGLPAGVATGKWERIQIPLSAFQRKANTGDYTLADDTGFITNMVRLYFYGSGSVSYEVSSIAAVAIGNVKKGKVPKVPKIVIPETPEDVEVPPENPFNGVDRKDPWGDKEKAAAQKKAAEEAAAKAKAKAEAAAKVKTIASGSCGAGLTWTLKNNGLLTVSGMGAMDNYDDVAPWDKYLDQIVTVQIEEGVTSVGNSAFYSCKNLTSVKLPGSLTSVGEYAFYECPSLTFAEVPGSVENVGPYSFGFVFDPVSGATVTKADFMLYGKKGSPANEYADLYGVPFAATQPGDGYYTTEDVYGPADPEVTALDSGACGEGLTWTFYDNGELVISGSGAMDDYEDTTPWEAYRSQITKVTVETGVTSIGNSAFYGYGALTEVTMAGTVARIGEYAFYECPSLLELNVPAPVGEIGEYAIGYVYSEEAGDAVVLDGFTMYGESGTPAEEYATKNNIPFGKLLDQGTCGEKLTWQFFNTGHLLISGTGAMDNYDDVAPWDAYVYDIKTVTLEEGVTSVGNSAFYSCHNLRSVNFPATLEAVGEYAFYMCPALASVKLPASVKTVGAYAFGYFYDEAADDAALQDGFTMYVTKASAPQEYAEAYKVPYELYGDEDEPGQKTDTETSGPAWWIWALIGLGAVVVLGGGACAVLIVLKKKKQGTKTEVSE